MSATCAGASTNRRWRQPATCWSSGRMTAPLQAWFAVQRIDGTLHVRDFWSVDGTDGMAAMHVAELLHAARKAGCTRYRWRCARRMRSGADGMRCTSSNAAAARVPALEFAAGPGRIGAAVPDLRRRRRVTPAAWRWTGPAAITPGRRACRRNRYSASQSSRKRPLPSTTVSVSNPVRPNSQPTPCPLDSSTGTLVNTSS